MGQEMKGVIMEGEQVMESMLPSPREEKGALVDIESARAVQEVQAAMIIAKRFPRDQTAAFSRIKEACKRATLAKEAMYAYPRAKTLITGPSIRLAEVIAQNWGNLQFGIRELSQKVTVDGGVSEVQAFAWDLETNTLQSKTFQVEHVRWKKEEGKVRLKDPRDIYELIANQGARRLRACILGVIPGDIVEAAVKQCEQTMEKGSDKPIAERIRDMVTVFEQLGVSQKLIEKRLGHKVDTTIAAELVTLQKIYRSIKDGMAKPEDFFDMPKEEFQAASDLQDKLEGKEQKFPCPHEGCDFEGVSERGLKKHLTQSHSETPPDTPDKEKDATTEPISKPGEEKSNDLDPDMPVECYKCKRTVAYKDAMIHRGKDEIERYWCGYDDCV
jgi:hypothetical protein